MPLVATSRMTGRIRLGQSFVTGDEATFISASWTRGQVRARVGYGLAVDGSEREIVENRAIRSIVAMARGDEFSKSIRYRLHLG
jgi:hypothetical protein